MKYIRQIICALAAISAAISFSGCENLTLDNGKYETVIPGREDFAAVYGDLIFLRLRDPSDENARNDYWDWAGKFEIEPDGRIILDMDKNLARTWKFHYDLYRRNGFITVYDLSAENAFNLQFRPAKAGDKQRSYPAIDQAAKPGEFNTYK